ncbi:MAG: ATPase [Lachnospiraceae bacterium]|nr:ATPase [Lachnospiraceae bacterium]
MTIDLKLQRFEEICLKDAKRQYDEAISEYTARQESLLDEYKKKARMQAEQQIEAEMEKIRRNLNRELSVNQIAIRRACSQKQARLRRELFAMLRQRLERFMESPAYEELLEHQIRQAKEFAGCEEIHIYMDPADERFRDSLSQKTGCEIRISQYPFFGGTRAVISARNILIDNSFETRLKEAEENFQFALGGWQHDGSR